MEEMSKALGDMFASAVTQLNECDMYAVLVSDWESEETDAYGPMSGMDALVEADRIHREMTSEGLEGISVDVIRMHS